MIHKATHLKQPEAVLPTPVQIEVPGAMLERQTHTGLPEVGALLLNLSLDFGRRKRVAVSVFCDTVETLNAFRLGERFEIKALVVGGAHRPTYVRAIGDSEWHQVVAVS